MERGIGCFKSKEKYINFLKSTLLSTIYGMVIYFTIGFITKAHTINAIKVLTVVGLLTLCYMSFSIIENFMIKLVKNNRLSKRKEKFLFIILYGSVGFGMPMGVILRDFMKISFVYSISIFAIFGVLFGILMFCIFNPNNRLAEK